MAAAREAVVVAAEEGMAIPVEAALLEVAEDEAAGPARLLSRQRHHKSTMPCPHWPGRRQAEE